MAGIQIPASAIGLPTTGGQVTAATLMPASGTGIGSIPEYCRVDASLHPVDTTAPDIKLAVALPTTWNNKALMIGGGGYDGVIPAVAAADALWFLPGVSSPLSRGYATYGSNSGHDRKVGADGKLIPSGFDASFAMNDEALRNYQGDALKKTHDAAMFLIQARYGKAPQHSFFAGGSTGGREALLVAQRWPQDFNGVISAAPAWNHGAILLDFGRMTRIFSKPGAWPNQAKQKLIYDAVISACDGLDGATDGIVSNQSACKFDPHVLRCPSGIDSGDTCLADAQIDAMISASSPMKLNYPLASGETGYAGWRFLAGGTITAKYEGMNAKQPANPIPQSYDTMVYAPTWQEQVRYVITRDPAYDALTLDPESPGQWQQRISDLSTREDANNPDLSPFANRGGKLLLIHGAADMWVSALSTEEYWKRVQTTMGISAVRNFARFYEVPGANHQPGVGAPFDPSWDGVKALEAWVEHGQAPQNLVATDVNAGANRSRPLCDFPTWPKFTGGDMNQAGNFSCVN
ncbi:tannase/feruloyl esterase family alpha/beta hydrolase [Cupriavidus taiwanensis]|uniref:tannase/feruloyl esterase family alpha/beta hydrolase n=1 Tax=Cupriavidus taiwanensis TaxID=164546 RepID=UPI001E5108AE|nr:tannase/feruloyl esterase family alpha/beta hydrolase [Cupriavidus taiwanensis]